MSTEVVVMEGSSSSLDASSSSMPHVSDGTVGVDGDHDAGHCRNGRHEEEEGEATGRSIGDIGLYSNVGSVPRSLIGALDDDDQQHDDAEGHVVEKSSSKSPEEPKEDDSRELPVVLRQLARRGYRPNRPCPISVLNEVDNMNYHGADASLELLDEILRRLKQQLAEDDDPSTKSLRLADVGSGYGGTARVMCHALSHGTTCVAVELQRPIHDTARILTRMAEMSGDLEPHAVEHVCGDAVTGEIDPPGLVPTDASLDAVVSRLAILHVPMAGGHKVALLRRCASWLRPGGVLAIEDYAESDTIPLTEEARRSLRDDVYVPGGALPTISGWKDMLTECGFVDIQIEDLTDRWARFVRERVVAAEGDDGGKSFDESMCGEDGDGDGDLEAGRRRREFFRSVDRLFNPPEEPNGLVGVRIYATKA